jgi:hypothetical protein
MNTDFHRSLAYYVNANDTGGANAVVMRELANILVKKKQDFVDLLVYSGINATMSMPDSELVDLFIHNIDTNKRLVIGSAFLVNQHNKTIGFDGEYEVSDPGVKATAQTMQLYFEGDYEDEDDEEYSNIPGLAGAIGGILDKGMGMAQKGMEMHDKKKNFGVNAMRRKQEAKAQMMQQLMAQKQAKIDAQRKAQEDKAKTTRMVLIAVSGLVVVGLIVTAVVLTKKKNN